MNHIMLLKNLFTKRVMTHMFIFLFKRVPVRTIKDEHIITINLLSSFKSREHIQNFEVSATQVSSVTLSKYGVESQRKV